MNVPTTNNARPDQDFPDIFSFRMITAKRTVNRMLSLSIGTTNDAGPSCRAL